MSSSTAGKPLDRRLLHVNEAIGATFHFGEKREGESERAAYHIEDGINTIGTDNCSEGVGIYIQISQHRCFFAHIYGFSWDNVLGKASSEKEGADIRKQVYKRLSQEMKKWNWDPLDPYFAKEVVACCPKSTIIRDGVPKRLASSYIIEAFEAFFAQLARKLKSDAEKHLTSANRIANADATSAEELRTEINNRRRTKQPKHIVNRLIEAKRQALLSVGEKTAARQIEQWCELKVSEEEGITVT